MKGNEGQLGAGPSPGTGSPSPASSSCCPFPRFVQKLHGYFCEAVAAGWNCSAAITSEGDLFMWGDNSMGQLGIGDPKVGRSAVPHKAERGQAPLFVGVASGWGHTAERGQAPLFVGVASGWGHTVAITQHGATYSWGFGSRGQLGHGDRSSLHAPKRVASLAEHVVRHVACGDMVASLKEHVVRHVACGDMVSAAVTTHGQVFMWGSGSHNRLGLGDLDDRCSPVCAPLDGQEVTQIAVAKDRVTQIAVAKDRVLAFAPVRLTTLQPNCGPLAGATRVQILGDGLVSAPRIK
ncbi:regulator of chromosome condensation 1/beta-lactamase-inhibitor protein II, partial [Baffinella frigidus]